MNRLVFKGAKTPGKAKIIREILHTLGGKDSGYSCLGPDFYYFINDYGIITGTTELSDKYKSKTIFTLEEFYAKFPYNINDGVKIESDDNFYFVENMFWSNNKGSIFYLLDNKGIYESEKLKFAYKKRINNVNKNNRMNNNVEQFKQIAKEISELYEKKNKAYGNSFGDTYRKLGIISAVTRISDKYNRLCNLAVNTDIDNLNESIEDTLKDLAAYAIMTLVELKSEK